MEFDTNIRFKDLCKVVINSDQDLDNFVHQIWDVAVSKCGNIAHAGESELWMDYSDLFRTRYISCLTEEVENGYELSFKAGQKPSIFGDVAIMALILAFFWMMSKVLVPSPQGLFIAGVIVAVGAIIAMVLHCGKPFGNKEAGELIKELQK